MIFLERNFMYAVYIEENNTFKPISFGDTQFECLIWLQDHPYFSKHYKTYIGFFFEQ